MSHSDTINELLIGFELLGTTESIPVAAFVNNENIFGLQFHPKVYHSTEGKKMTENFLVKKCGCKLTIYKNLCTLHLKLYF
jgi:GMP synthase (glutamine-hydrolysing)